MSGIRREPRIAVMILVEASWQDHSGGLHTVAARMEDKSPGGACIRIRKQVGVGSRLNIQWRRERFSGTARYCRNVGIDYLVGIQRDPQGHSLSTCTAAVTPSRILAPAASIPIRQQPRTITPQESVLNQIKRGAVSPAGLCSRATSMASAAEGHPEPLTTPGNSPPQRFPTVRLNELPPKAPDEKEVTERKSMRHKWLELPHWQNKQNGTGPHSNGNGNGTFPHANEIPTIAVPDKKLPARALAEEIASFRVDLLPVEDIYRTAGILNPPKGYSINKVVNMLHSQHIRELSNEMKRAAVLMALDSAGVPVEQVLQDARSRQAALESYEVEQRKQVETEWACKAEENAQIEAELERLRVHYMARINRNLEGVAREKATFNSWLTLKQQEAEGIAEAVELCMNPGTPQPASRLLPELSMASSIAEPEYPGKKAGLESEQI